MSEPVTQNSDQVSPAAVLRQLAASIPEDCRKNLVIVGSLAAGYRFFGDRPELFVRTKDVDCLLSPRVDAIEAGRRITEQLFDSGWTFHGTEEFPHPGNADTADGLLPVVRLAPPAGGGWFVELLTGPESEDDFAKRYIRLTSAHGDFSLCSFGGVALTQHQPIETEYGIFVARPEMMALANLLHHKGIGHEKMTGAIEGRSIKRSNKDLGRVLALAYLAEDRDEDALLAWPDAWEAGLKNSFPNKWQELANGCGEGLITLLASRADFDEAVHTCQHGLIAAKNVSAESLRVAGERLLQDVVLPFADNMRKG